MRGAGGGSKEAELLEMRREGVSIALLAKNRLCLRLGEMGLQTHIEVARQVAARHQEIIRAV